MKRIARSKRFKKSYKTRIQLNESLDMRFQERIKLFIKGERGAPILDHALSGSRAGTRSFSITGDIRVIYRETEEYYEFLDIGTHSQVYK